MHYIHESKDQKELFSSKHEIEIVAAQHGVNIEHIWANHSVYASTSFKTDCVSKNQKLTFCTIGGHWKNGVVERYIGHIIQTVRTILLHDPAKWPGTISKEFWPFAICLTCIFYNALFI
jgi:hypothetical protein